MTYAGLDDRSVTLLAAPEQVALVAGALSSRTRIAVLSTLVRSSGAVHINEAARLVGVDASPVRTHLEVLVRSGLAAEVPSPVGRERRFATRLKDVRITLEGVHRAAAPEKGREPPKQVVRLARKLAALEKDMARLQEAARKVKREIEAAWEKATADRS